MGGSKCQWSRLVVVPLSVLLPRPPAGSFVERLSEIQACLYMSKYSALHTYSAYCQRTSMVALSMYTIGQRKAIRCPRVVNVLQAFPWDKFC